MILRLETRLLESVVVGRYWMFSLPARRRVLADLRCRITQRRALEVFVFFAWGVFKGTLKSFDDCKISLVALIFSPKVFLNNISSEIVALRVSLTVAFMFGWIRFLRTDDSAYWRSTRSRLISLSCLKREILPSKTSLIVLDKAFPTAVRQAAIFLYFATMRSSRFKMVS